MTVSDAKDGGSAGPSAHSASDDSKNDNSKQDDGSDDDEQPRNDWHRRALAEAKKAKAKAAEAEAKLQELLTKEKDREQQDLIKRGEFEKVIADVKAQKATAEAKLATFQKQEEDRRKLAAVLNQVGGNIDRKFWNLVDFDDVVLDSATNEIDQMSVQSAAEKFKATYPEIIRKHGGARLPTDAPNGSATGGKISESEWRKLPPAKMREYKKDQIEFDV